MTRLLLVRHARPAADWDARSDPPLDPVGVQQAERLADRLAGQAPRPVVTSPLRRARETAAPLAARWATAALVVPAVGEIPSPVDDPVARGEWLRGVVAQRWTDVDETLRTWRAKVLDTLTTFEEDTVVFTHYVAINTAVGAATHDDRVICCAPSHASATELTVDGGRLALVSFGATGADAQIDSPM